MLGPGEEIGDKEDTHYAAAGEGFRYCGGHARLDRFEQRGIRKRTTFKLALAIAVATVWTISSASAQTPPPATINGSRFLCSRRKISCLRCFRLG
jgi:hypothetical protein